MAFFYLIVLGTAVWVGIDASNLGFSRGRLGGGPLDMGVASYVLCTLLIWIIGFPCYLVARSRYVAMKNSGGYGAAGYVPAGYGNPVPTYGNPVPTYGNPVPTYGAAPTYGTVPAQTAPPQYSPDGQWWWNGQEWTPVTAAPAAAAATTTAAPAYGGDTVLPS